MKEHIQDPSEGTVGKRVRLRGNKTDKWRWWLWVAMTCSNTIPTKRMKAEMEYILMAHTSSLCGWKIVSDLTMCL